jgi:hypothetical protein
MIAYAELRRLVRGWPKHAGCRPVVRAPLVTPAFPGAFNLSSTEHHWLREYGGFLDWDHDYVFTTVQSCVRLADWALLPGPAGRRHLGVFEMADLCGEIALRTRPDYRALLGWQAAELVRLLGRLGVPASRLHVSYCLGGSVAALSGGRYRFPDRIPPDALSREAFLEAGVPDANLMGDATRATLLALHVHRPTPWGYRNEIHVDVGSSDRQILVDVATLEYFLWRPRFGRGSAREDIVGLEPLETGATGIGCGLERLALVANRLARIRDVDYLQPFYALLQEALGRPLGDADALAGESLRALHRIEADRAGHPEAEGERSADGALRLSRRRRKKLARLKRCIPARLGEAALERLLAAHAAAQPWHASLAAAVAPTLCAILEYRRSPGRDLVTPG